MRNLLFEIAYNGARYHGYQVQSNAVTITQTLQDAIQRVLKKREGIVGCSRTDSKVHANSYYFNMKTESKIPVDKLILLLNRVLPDDILVKSCKDVDLDFHARYHCKGKEYIYKIHNGEHKDPFLSELALHYKKHIDAEELNQIAQVLVGTHDFKSFCSTGGKDVGTVRTVYEVEIHREGELVILRIKGDGFLYNMVRIIVGTLLFMNDGKIPKDAMQSIIAAKDRTEAGKTAPACGLYLNYVEY